VAVEGVTSFGGRETLAGVAAMPVGLLTALAIPSFVSARSQTARISCINNLRQIDLAKEQWAIDKDKRAGDIPTLQDLQPYLKQVPGCPEGGAYTFGPIGQNPRCNRPGHVLQLPAMPKMK